MDRQPAALCGPTSAPRRPQAPRRRALRALHKLTSECPVPQAAQRALAPSGLAQLVQGLSSALAIEDAHELIAYHQFALGSAARLD